MKSMQQENNPGIIFFLVSNLYIHLKPFQRVSALLKEQGVKSTLFYLDSGTNKSLAGAGCAINGLHKFPPFRAEISTQSIPAAKIMQFAGLLADKYSFRNFLQRNRPALFVTGGDITDVHGRLLHDTCRSLAIKTLIVPVTIPGPAFVNPDADKGIPLAGLARKASSFFGLEKTIFFRDWVLGSYDTNAIIALPDKAVFDVLTRNGISEQRLFVTGNPVHDDLFELLNQPRFEIEQEVKSGLGIADDKRILLYCTEIIQDVYGAGYLQKINSRLEKAFSGLPKGYTVVIKFHPREPQGIKDLYRETFRGPGYAFAEHSNVLKLIRSSELTVAHYSAVLKDAALLGSPLLSIKADENMPVLFGSSSELVHSYPDEVELKIGKLLFDCEFQDNQKRLLREWMLANQINIDGRSSARIAELITRLSC